MDAPTAALLLELAETMRPKLRGADAKPALEQFEPRYAEVATALEWFEREGQVDQARRLTIAMVPIWMATKRLDDGLRQSERVLALPGGDEGLRARALFGAGYLAFWKGDYDRSSRFHHEAIACGRKANNPTAIALALTGLARIALQTSTDEARRLCREAIAVTEGTDDEAGRSSAMHVLGVAAQMAGDLQEARDVMNRRIELARQKEDVYTISSESGNLCMVERQLGHFDEAEVLGRKALEIDVQTGNEIAIPWKVNGLAAVAADRGELERAAVLIGIADSTMASSGGSWPPDELAQYEQTVAKVNDGLGVEECGRLRGRAQAMTTAAAVAFALAARSTSPAGLGGSDT